MDRGQGADMRRLGRKRRILAWGGLVISVLIVDAWILSMRWACCYRFGDRGPRLVAISRGGVEFSYAPLRWGAFRAMRLDPGWGVDDRYGENRDPVIWVPRVDVSPQVASGVLPLWIPFLLVAGPTAMLWWRGSRRIPPGHCRVCGYDLTGNTSGVCSECGSAVAAREDRAAPR